MTEKRSDLSLRMAEDHPKDEMRSRIIVHDCKEPAIHEKIRAYKKAQETLKQAVVSHDECKSAAFLSPSPHLRRFYVVDGEVVEVYAPSDGPSSIIFRKIHKE